ncbi:MAG: acyl-CoA/acyl-ACP dehydrogenase [Desulfobacteraceae bacterium]|nr:acyl-CoA/acyl-ACP dehydrogenase [Desulfobacteraceae bacterium]
MDFTFNNEQNLLRQSIREFLTKECESEFVREMEEDEKGYTPELWRGMANLGWMGLIFPEKYGGTEGDFLDLVVMMEEMGRACLPGPFFSTVVLGGLTILEAGNESQLSEFLLKIVGGDMIFTLALNEPAATKYDPPLITVKASAEKDNYIIDGIKLFVPDANVADYIICVARTEGEMDSREGITLFLVDAKTPGIKCTLLKTVARDKQCEVIFDKVKVPGRHILGELNKGWPCIEKILQKAAVAKCAEMVGGAQRVLEMATGYAKKREQFGQVIGSFQAVQHHFANMLIDIDGGKFITYKAAWMLSEGIPCNREVAAAKAWVSEAYKRVVALGHEILGGVGYMTEHDMTLYSRRAKAAEIAFGDANLYRKVVAQDIGL